MTCRFFRISAVCLVVTFGLSAFAQFKVAVVNPQTAIFETEVGKEVRDEWDTADKPEVDRLNALEAEVIALQERLRTDGDILSTTEVQDLNDQIQGKTELYQTGLQSFNKLGLADTNAFMRDYRPRFNAVLQDLIEIEGYDLVFTYNPQSTNILYMNAKHDITRKVTEMLNDRENEELPEELTDVEESEEATEEGSADESSEGGE